ncbi:MAG: dinitrogenase iron-molybdenum cofactor biosynthesis protein [Syntrophomonadaceae bacterium]|jgi:predicted Fe-Mo cluster-binding NifX family protein|nr:dinitrogenase iron-molybdenum cofactor biosynthesis protein [Syntrophomonadaceae bacterium]
MKHIVAIATVDGKTIYQHFGHAEVFQVVSISDKDYTYVESRKTTPSCQDFQHSQDAFEQVISVLHDCEAIFVGKIGPGAAARVVSSGKRVFETPGLVDDVLRQVIEQHLLD